MVDYHVGQKLWFSPDRRERPCEVTVTKVGRVWVTLSNGYRAAKATGRVDSGFTAHVYASQADYLDFVARNNLWRYVMNRLAYCGAPSSFSLDDIKDFATKCGVTLRSDEVA